MALERVQIQVPDWWEYGHGNPECWVDFVTWEDRIILHDGTVVTSESFRYGEKLTDAAVEAGLIRMMIRLKYDDRFEAGKRYAHEHGIPQAPWARKMEEEDRLNEEASKETWLRTHRATAGHDDPAGPSDDNPADMFLPPMDAPEDVTRPVLAGVADALGTDGLGPSG